MLSLGGSLEIVPFSPHNVFCGTQGPEEMTCSTVLIMIARQPRLDPQKGRAEIERSACSSLFTGGTARPRDEKGLVPRSSHPSASKTDISAGICLCWAQTYVMLEKD